MRKKIEDIRIAEPHTNIINKRVLGMGHVITQLFYRYIGDYYMEDVNIIGIYITVSEYDKNYHILPTDDSHSYNLKHLYTYINEKYLLSLNDYDKMKLVGELIYKSLIDLAVYNSLPLEPIDEAYKKIIETDYFYEPQKKYKSKNKKYTCWLEYRKEYTICTYRLGFMNNDGEIKRFLVRAKEYSNYDNYDKTDYIKFLLLPRELKVTGWISSIEFEMYWGEEEKYIFNAEKEEVKRVL